MTSYSPGRCRQRLSVRISIIFAYCSNYVLSVIKMHAVLVLMCLSVLPVAAVADALPSPTWHVGGTPLASSAIEACAILSLQYIRSTGHTVIDTTDPNEKICQIWEGQFQQSAGVLGAQCFFNGVISGSINGHGYWPYGNIRMAPEGGACVCPAETPEYDSKFGICHRASVYSTLSILGSTETLPSGPSGISEITLTAKTTTGGSPKPGIATSFSVEVIPNSGGHEHHDINRPKGTLSAVQGTTDGNGEVSVTFTAPEFAGIHTVNAICATCSNSPASKEIQVKVPDLLPISPSAPQNADGSYVYALTSVDKTHQGNGRFHHNQYYLTAQSRKNLRALISNFAAEGWGTVALNDASLFWGGRYDISSNWAGSHKGHREGREIDISFARANNPISVSKQSDFYDKFCKNKKVSFPFSILHHYVNQPHFHVYLEKQTACFKSEK